jgi:hypothetical protein
MADEVKEGVLEEVTEMTSEEREVAWEKWVKDGIDGLIDVFLKPASDCHYNIKYLPHVMEVQESGPVYDDSKADGVVLTVMFKFKEPVEPLKEIED